METCSCTSIYFFNLMKNPLFYNYYTKYKSILSIPWKESS